MPQQHTVAFTNDVWNLVEEVAEGLFEPDGRGNHAPFVHLAVAEALAQWKNSPYRSIRTNAMIVVARDGAVYLHLLQDLQLHERRLKLPMQIDQKPAKLRYYEQQKPPELSMTDWMRSRWLISYFAVWNTLGLDLESTPPLDSSINSSGVVTKACDLNVDRREKAQLTREVVIGLRDYVEWEDDFDDQAAEYDRAELPIDVPTQSLELAVVLDQDLYRFTEIGSSEIPSIALQLRNRESALYRKMDFRRLLKVDPISQESAQDTKRAVEKRFTLFARRLKWLEARGHITKEAYSELTNSRGQLTLPPKYLPAYIPWNHPPLGTVVCARWMRPKKGPSPTPVA